MPRRNKLLRRQSKPIAKHAKPKTSISGPQVAKRKPSNDGQLKKKHKQQQQQHDQPTIPFRPQDRILLIGEGDLSFAASIIRHHGCTNVTATVLERDHAELCAKYPSVDANIAVIERRPRENTEASSDQDAELASSGSPSEDEEVDEDEDDDDDDDDDDDEEKRALPVNNKLIYGVDATKLPSSITRHPHDHIIFNFPHVGGKSTDINRQVRHNQELLVSFFQRALSSSTCPLAPRGTIIITLFEAEPYTLWNIRDLARHAGLQVLRSFRFQADAYPGYRHARTLGVLRNKKTGEEGGGRWRGEERAARSYVFVRKGEGEEVVGKKKRKRGEDDSSSDED